jgi:DNA-binding transcriptional ArsR family regulator
VTSACAAVSGKKNFDRDAVAEKRLPLRCVVSSPLQFQPSPPPRAHKRRLSCTVRLNGNEVKPTVSHHLAKLKAAGLVNVRRDGQSLMYSIDTTVF